MKILIKYFITFLLKIYPNLFFLIFGINYKKNKIINNYKKIILLIVAYFMLILIKFNLNKNLLTKKFFLEIIKLKNLHILI